MGAFRAGGSQRRGTPYMGGFGLKPRRRLARERILVDFARIGSKAIKDGVRVVGIGSNAFKEMGVENHAARCRECKRLLLASNLKPNSVDVLTSPLTFGYYPRPKGSAPDTQRIPDSVLAEQANSLADVLRIAFPLQRSNGHFSIVIDKRTVGPNALGILKEAITKTGYVIGEEMPVPKNRAYERYPELIHDAVAKGATMVELTLFKERL